MSGWWERSRPPLPSVLVGALLVVALVPFTQHVMLPVMLWLLP